MNQFRDNEFRWWVKLHLHYTRFPLILSTQDRSVLASPAPNSGGAGRVGAPLAAPSAPAAPSMRSSPIPPELGVGSGVSPGSNSPLLPRTSVPCLIPPPPTSPRPSSPGSSGTTATSARPPNRFYIIVNDGSIGRMDIAWWRQQGRTLFRDLAKHRQNAAPGGGMF